MSTLESRRSYFDCVMGVTREDYRYSYFEFADLSDEQKNSMPDRMTRQCPYCKSITVELRCHACGAPRMREVKPL